MNIRVGFGSDTHQLKKDYNLVIGGVKIQHEKGAVGHSDADVLFHAICDACLGASGLRDIGFQFPDTDNAYKEINSGKLLKKVYQLISKKGYKIQNLDSTVHLENPKISKYIQEMKSNIASILKIDPDNVSVKAKTSEKLGPVGREEGIMAEAVVLLVAD